MPKLSKKKQADLAQQEQEARIRAALHWTETAEGPDVMPPLPSDPLATGYVFNAYVLRVDVACTSSAFHAIGRIDRIELQRPMRLYSSRLRALLALRNVVERECAERLAKIDQLIAEEENNATVDR